MSLRRLAVLLALLVFAAVGVAACGDDNNDSGSTGGGASTAAPADTSGGTDTAASGGTDTAAAGGLLDPGKRTIGVIPSTAASEHLSTRIKQLQQLGDKLGWKIVVQDGAGDPRKMEAGMQALVNQKVDAIWTMALGGEEIPKGLAAAKAAKIPVLAVITDPSANQFENYDGIFADGVLNFGQKAGEWLQQNRPDQTYIGMRITQNFAGDGFIQGMEKSGIKFADMRDTVLADIVNSMTKNCTASAQKNKGDSDGYVFVEFSDFGGPLCFPVFDRAGRKDIEFMTRYDNASNVKLALAGNKMLIVGSQGYQHMFDAAEALIKHWNDPSVPIQDAPDISEPGFAVTPTADIPKDAVTITDFDGDLAKKLEEWKSTIKLAG